MSEPVNHAGLSQAEKRMRVSFPPDPNPRKPKLVAPPGSWDTHFHVYAPHLFPFADKRPYTPPSAPVEHYLQINSAIGLERGVIVGPSVHGHNRALTTDAVAKSNGRLVGMIRSDPQLTAAEIGPLHDAGVRGIRFPVSRTRGDALNLGVFRHNYELIKDTNWVVDFQIDADVIVENADMIRRSKRPVIIDTWARLDPRAGFDHETYRVLIDLLRNHDVYLKIHGANRYLSRGYSFSDVVAMAHHIIPQAPDRILWGTDWPHSEIYAPNQMPNDGDLLDMLLDFAPDEAVRKKILADNPARLFDTK